MVISPNACNESAAREAHIVIVGGGITGLSAAFYLGRAARAAGVPVRCTLIERSARFGGKIASEAVPGPGGAFVVEGGPDSFVTQKPWALQLARDLGLAGRLLEMNSTRASTYVLRAGRPVPMPAGMQLIFPTEIGPFLRSPLLSWPGRLRMLREPWVPARHDDADETLADFMRRRFGAEALDRLGEPLLAGIHSSDPERQSLLMTFPRFREMERKHGSILRAMRAARKARHAVPQPAPAPFVTLRGGIGELLPALLAQIDATLLSGRGVAALDHNPAAAQKYRLRLDNGQQLEADVVIVATPAWGAAELLAPWRPELAGLLRQIRYVSSATVSLAYPTAAIKAPIGGFGLVIPHSERRQINALTVASQKFAGRAPEGHTLIRVFAGGARTPETAALDDERLLAAVQAELRAILGVEAAPLWSRIYRWPDGHPQYEIGHIERLARIDMLRPEGLLLAGSSYRGVGLPDCIHQGQAAAEQALEIVKSRAAAVAV